MYVHVERGTDELKAREISLLNSHLVNWIHFMKDVSVSLSRVCICKKNTKVQVFFSIR